MTYPLFLIPLMPLLGALLNGLIAMHVAYHQKKPCEKTVSLIGVLFPVLSFVFVLTAVWPFLFHEVATPRIEPLFVEWMAVGNFKLDFAFRIDRLSALMTLVVTGVGSLIHLYSTGYMKGDAAFARYFAYLNLFLFSMLLLVLGDNLLVLFIGWEGVGLCSYLLIGFWFDDPAKASAGKKAFIVNRIGDFGFLLAVFIIAKILLQNPEASAAGIFSFETLEHHKDLLAPMAAAICLLLFVGATGKSAQIPLYVWLPDAMAGPTPVSALIHAATMVTAGVYMVARLSFLYDLAFFDIGPFLNSVGFHFKDPVIFSVRTVVATVGATTALFAATIGLVQRDIKKVLAYSTVSQLGFMFLGVGIGANSAGVFHLMTHAFFKACLFLGSGSVIHAMHGEQDIFKMGGLKKWMPVTFWTFLIATIAIAGIPPFAGFFSKDEILYRTLDLGHPVLWGMGLVAAAFTAFYMFRLVALTFLGNCRADHHTQEHLHESPWTMTLPLIVLAGLSVIGGFVGIPEAFGGHNLLHHWLGLEGGIQGNTEAIHQSAEHEWFEQVLAAMSAVWAIFWSSVALFLYLKRPQWMQSLSERLRALHQLIFNKYYVDEIYECLIVKPLHWISQKVLWRGVDAGLIDGVIVNGSAKTTAFLGQLAGLLQNGMVNTYALWFVLGLVGLLFWILK